MCGECVLELARMFDWDNFRCCHIRVIVVTVLLGTIRLAIRWGEYGR